MHVRELVEEHLAQYADDPDAAWVELSRLQRDLAEAMEAIVKPARMQAAHEAYAGGRTWQDLGEMIGVGRSRARQIAYGYSGGQRPEVPEPEPEPEPERKPRRRKAPAQ